MRAEIISVGTELLLGDILNTNARFLAQQLAALGFSVYYQTVVGDNTARLKHLVADAKERSDVLIFTGGLGPTDDDLTKETVAEAFGDILVLDEGELAELQAFFRARGREMTENNRKQAMVPRRGRKLPNPNGTAPGAYFRLGDKHAFLLPGPPREMEPMFFEQVMPVLEQLQDSAIRSVVLRVFGVGEAELEERVRSLLESSNPTAALYAQTNEVHIRVTAKGPTAEQADLMCDQYAELFREALGDLIYAENDDNLETTVVKLLLEKGQTLATAESCTGGLLGERITSVPGASGVYGFGAITYANEAKHEMLGVRNGTLRRYGAVSGPVAAEMAFGAAKKGLADYGVGITGVAGPDGGTAQKPAGLVYIALAHGREVFLRRVRVRARGRAYVRGLATQNALDMIRRRAAGLPLPGTKRFTRNQEADYERAGRPRRRGGSIARAVLALVLVVAIFVLALVGLSAARRGGQAGGGAADGVLSAQGLRYGSAEYTTAACELVAAATAANPSVVGFVALPGSAVEALVAQAHFGGQGALKEAAAEAGVGELAVMGADASPAQGASNTVLLGGNDFSKLLEYRQGNAEKEISTFTYYTARDARVYQVFSLLVADAGEQTPDGFDPLAGDLAATSDFLTFALGAKARSYYSVPVDLLAGDSFMTLAVDDPTAEGRRLYLCGRLMRQGETAGTPAATAAGDPLMPGAYYAQSGLEAPDTRAVQAEWMRWYLNRGTENQTLQLLAGMPAQDLAPVVREPLTEPVTPAATPEPPPEEEAPTSDTEESDSASNAEDETGTAGDTQAESGSETDAGASTTETEEDESASESATPSSSAPTAPSRPAATTTLPPVPKRTSAHELTVTMNGEVVTGSTLNILARICQSEAAGLETEAVKAVAVAAHSWILCQQGAGITAPAVVGAVPSPAVVDAVREVAYRVLSGDRENPAFTPFYHMAAYGTNSAEGVWGQGRSYLASVASPYEQGLDGWRTITTLAAEEVGRLLGEKLGLALDGVAPESWFGDIEKNEGGYVQSVRIGGTEVSGRVLWGQVLAQDGRPLLQSPAFEVEYDGNNFVFITYGSGHGCGMSLLGAASYAKEGWSYERILEHYYPGAQLVDWE